MRLETLTARGLMGASFTEKLGPANIFIGMNWGGKTTRANAATLLLLGYLPTLKKTNADTFRLASGREMAVEGEFTGGVKLSRTWKVKGDSVTLKSDIPDGFADEGDLAIMLNADAYFAMSDQQRVDYVFGLLDLSGTEFTPDKIIAELAKAIRPQEDAATQKAFDSLVKKIGTAAKKAERELCQAPGDELTPQQWLSVALEAAADFTKTSKDFAKRMEETVRGITQLKLADANAEGASLESIEADIAKRNEERVAIIAERERLTAHLRQIEAARKRRGEIIAKLEELKTARERLASLRVALDMNTAGTPEALAERDRVTARLAELNTIISETARDTRTREEYTEQLPKLREARTKLAECQQRFDAICVACATEKIDAADRAIEAAQVPIRNANAETCRIDSELKRLGFMIEEREKALASIEAAKKCPTCHAAGEGWKTLRTAELTGELTKLREEKTGLESARAALHAGNAQRDADLEAARKVRQSIREANEKLGATHRELEGWKKWVAECDRIEAELAKLRVEDPAIEAEHSTLYAKQSALRQAAAARQSIEAQIADAERAAGDSDKLTAELGALMPDDPNVAAEIEVRAGELAQINGAITLAETQRKAALQRQQDVKRAAEAEQQHKEAAAEVIVAKKAVETLKEVQEKFVASAFEPVLTQANKFFGSLLEAPLAYHAGEIGARKSGQWVSHKTFSGAERRLAYCAISLALASRSKVKLAIIDELGTIHDKVLPRVLDVVKTALDAGFITQFIGCDASREAFYLQNAEKYGLNVRSI